MTKTLIPDAALDKHVALLGMTGAGKSSVIRAAIVEPDLDADRRDMIITPKDDYWGLRLSKNGKSKGYDIPIFGGWHGDYPLNVKDAALLAETYATMKGSAIFVTSRLSVQDRARWFAAFAETILSKNKGWARLVIDEAHVYMPKQGGKGGGAIPMALHAGNELVSQGRSLGLRIVLASQRSAKLHNDALTQCSCLMAMMLMAPHDRDAVKDWIEDQADPVKGREIIASLATLKEGQAWVWAPRAKMLEKIQFPMPKTFDSSAAADEDSGDGPELTPINLDALKGKLATVEAEKKANDPKELKTALAARDREIAELKRAVTATPVADSKAIETAERRGFARGVGLACRDLAVFKDAIEGSSMRLGFAFATWDNARSSALSTVETAQASLGKLLNAPSPRPAPSVSPRTPSYAKPAAPKGNGDASGDDRPLGAERKPLAALAAVHPAGMTEAQWAVSSGLKRTGGTWSAYVSRLKMAGRFAQQGDLYFVTDKGLADLGEVPAPLPSPGRDLVEFWAGKINGVGPMIRRLADVYPDYLTKDQLAADLNMAASGGTFGAYLSRLRSPGLIEEDRDKNVRAAPQLMEGV
ncbi:MAG: hypothetical protein Q7S17_05765 [Xanthobacteraceae bacterium]|nr:hypothetical protein [Xanthobacteraceae bacterium]